MNVILILLPHGVCCVSSFTEWMPVRSTALQTLLNLPSTRWCLLRLISTLHLARAKIKIQASRDSKDQFYISRNRIIPTACLHDLYSADFLATRNSHSLPQDRPRGQHNPAAHFDPTINDPATRTLGHSRPTHHPSRSTCHIRHQLSPQLKLLIAAHNIPPPRQHIVTLLLRLPIQYRPPRR